MNGSLFLFVTHIVLMRVKVVAMTAVQCVYNYPVCSTNSGAI